MQCIVGLRDAQGYSCPTKATDTLLDYLKKIQSTKATTAIAFRFDQAGLSSSIHISTLDGRHPVASNNPSIFSDIRTRAPGDTGHHLIDSHSADPKNKSLISQFLASEIEKQQQTALARTESDDFSINTDAAVAAPDEFLLQLTQEETTIEQNDGDDISIDSTAAVAPPPQEPTLAELQLKKLKLVELEMQKLMNKMQLAATNIKQTNHNTTAFSQGKTPPLTEHRLIRQHSSQHPNNADFAKSLTATGRAIAGHGYLPKITSLFQVPDNIILRTYRVPGQDLSDRIGIHIEAGHIDYLTHSDKYKDEIFIQTFQNRQRAPNYKIYPADNTINPIAGSITVDQPIDLSELLLKLSKDIPPGETMTVDLATCQSHIIPNIDTDPQLNIKQRFQNLIDEMETLIALYGRQTPPKVLHHLLRTLANIEQDLNTHRAEFAHLIELGLRNKIGSAKDTLNHYIANPFKPSDPD